MGYIFLFFGLIISLWRTDIDVMVVISMFVVGLVLILIDVDKLKKLKLTDRGIEVDLRGRDLSLKLALQLSIETLSRLTKIGAFYPEKYRSPKMIIDVYREIKIKYPNQIDEELTQNFEQSILRLLTVQTVNGIMFECKLPSDDRLGEIGVDINKMSESIMSKNIITDSVLRDINGNYKQQVTDQLKEVQKDIRKLRI